jgi:hypothetical protein
MSFRIRILILLTCLTAPLLSAQKIDKGFEALKVFNFATAKDIFEKNLRKDTVGAAFGMANYYLVENTPFFQIDSSLNWYQMAQLTFTTQDEKSKAKLAEFGINEIILTQFKNKLQTAAFNRSKQIHTLHAYNWFILTFSDAPEVPQAISQRDQIAFDSTEIKKTVTAWKEFMNTYPKSSLMPQAEEKYETLLYHSLTAENTPEVFQEFISQHPKNRWVAQAQDSLYILATHLQNLSAYENFIQNFPENRNIEKAWIQLYHLSIDFSKCRQHRFGSNRTRGRSK